MSGMGENSSNACRLRKNMSCEREKKIGCMQHLGGGMEGGS